MAQDPQYLSTDPNAGTPIPTTLTGLRVGDEAAAASLSEPGYLSTDPNAGESVPEPSRLQRIADAILNRSLIPGLSSEIDRTRERSTLQSALGPVQTFTDLETGTIDPRLVVEAMTTPLSVAAETVGVAFPALLRQLRALRAPARVAAPGVPGGRLVRAGGQEVVRATAPEAAAVAGPTEEAMQAALDDVLQRLRAVDRPQRVTLPPGPPQPPVSFPPPSTVRAAERRAARAAAQRAAATSTEAAPPPAAVPEPPPALPVETAIPGGLPPEVLPPPRPPVERVLPRMVEPVAARPTTPVEEVIAALRERPAPAPAARTFEELSDELVRLDHEVTRNTALTDAEFQAAARRMKEIRSEMATRFPDRVAAREAAAERSARQAGLDALAGRRSGEVVFSDRLTPATPPTAAEEAAILRGRKKLIDQLPEGARVSSEDMGLLDHLAAAYRDADRRFLEAQRAFTEGTLSTEGFQQVRVARREAGKALRQAELKILRAAEEQAKRGLASEAGIVAPQLMQTVFGGTIGAAAGARLDPEHPLRGAALGALAGAALPGTAIGTAKSIRSQGLSAVGKVYISGLLSGPWTAVRNVTSVAANGLLRMVAHPASTTLDVIRTTAKGGKRSVTLGEITPSMIATWTGFKRGAADALTTFLTGDSPYKELFVGAPVARRELAGGLSNAANWIPRALDALDTWMGRIVEAQTIAARAYTEAFNRGGNLAQRWQLMGRLQANPTAAIKAAADFEARRQLFRGEAGKIANFFINTRSGLNSMTPLPIGDFLIPFVRVPSQIAKQAIEASPGGIFMSRAGLSTAQRMESLGRTFAGSLITGVAAQAVLEGRISGRGPAQPTERQKLQETGWRPYSINVPVNVLGLGTQAEDGSYWISLNALGPVGMMLGTVADTIEGWKDLKTDEDTKFQQALQLVGRFGSSFADQTFLTDSLELAESLNNPQMFERYFARKAGSLVPAAVRDVARIYDPVSRESGFEAGALAPILANTPLASRSLPARIDRFGQEIRRPRAGAPPPQHPARAVLQEADARLNKSQARITVSPTTEDGARLRRVLEAAGFEFDDNDQIKLTPSERRRLQQQRGQQLADAIAKLRNSQTYRALPSDAQRVVIDRLKRRIERERRLPELIELIRQRRSGG